MVTIRVYWLLFEIGSFGRVCDFNPLNFPRRHHRGHTMAINPKSDIQAEVSATPLLSDLYHFFSGAPLHVSVKEQ